MAGDEQRGSVDVLPLDGLTVVALEQAVAAPFATRQLADLGARVVKVERPRVGDFARGYDESVAGQSSFFVWLNRGKESLTLDLKDEMSRRVMSELLAEADVFVQNLAPGATERLGLGAKQLTDSHPSLIVCDVSGYGADGPWSHRKAYDLLMQCETGLVSITGMPGSPAKVGISIADIAAGMYAFSGVLTALVERPKTGHGRALSVSLLDSLGEWMSAPALMTAGSGKAPRPAGLAHASIAPYGPYPTADGTVVVAVQNEREFAQLAAHVLHQAALITDSRFSSNSARVAHRGELDRLIADATSHLATDQFMAILDEAGIANARVNDLPGFLDHPQLAARGRWRDVSTPAGSVRCLAPPVTFDGLELPMRPVPGLGEHTEQVLTELGLTREDIAAMRRRDAI